MAAGYFYTMNTSGAVAAQQQIPMTTTGTTFGSGTGTAPTLAADGGVDLAAGTYEVTYEMTMDANQGDEEIEDFLTANGTTIPGSEVVSTQSNSAPIYTTNTNTITITVPAGGEEIQLHNGDNPGDFGVATENNADFITGAINVEQLE